MKQDTNGNGKSRAELYIQREIVDTSGKWKEKKKRGKETKEAKRRDKIERKREIVKQETKKRNYNKEWMKISKGK